MGLSEAQIEKSVCDYARERGCLVYKFSSPGRRGVPDRMFIAPGGTVFFIEFKAPGGKPSTLQRREINKLLDQGANAVWVGSIEAGEMVVSSHVK